MYLYFACPGLKTVPRPSDFAATQFDKHRHYINFFTSMQLCMQILRLTAPQLTALINNPLMCVCVCVTVGVLVLYWSLVLLLAKV